MSMKDSSVYVSPTDYCTAPINNMGQGTISIGVAWGLVQVGVVSDASFFPVPLDI
jgi:hypothetical protein